MIGGDSSEQVRRLNLGCFCETMDRHALANALDHEVGVAGFAEALSRSHPLLFSNVGVFVSAAAFAEMTRTVEAVQAASRLPGYRDAVMGWAAPISLQDHGPAGALMGYDFHITPAGAKLIEINTNAGGAFLNAPLARAQGACCATPDTRPPSAEDFARDIAEMFVAEWRGQGRPGRPTRIAIVDDSPTTQHLFPEFELAQALLRSQGFDTVIADPSDLTLEGADLCVGGEAVDLVYNRLTDFALEDPAHAVLAEAYRSDRVVVTPNPHVYALFADKRNLTVLSDRERLLAWKLGAAALASLAASTLPTRLVSADNADALWNDRKAWFFKPARGYAGKAVYRGEKLTRRVWGEIVSGQYIAQAYAQPELREVRHDGSEIPLKADVRLYTYQERVLLMASRLYQGQITNMRTAGGGFAPALLVPSRESIPAKGADDAAPTA
jgi:hypothetical protein